MRYSILLAIGFGAIMGVLAVVVLCRLGWV